jgi:Uma2 family endonuclease
MIIAQPETKRYSPAEYLELEIAAEQRHEYINGDIIQMAGGTPNHNLIVSNLNAGLNFALKRQPYRVFVADQRLWIPDRQIYTYPDVMVVQGDLQYQPGRTDTIINPLMIAEVLSPSTKDDDRGDKFQAYRTIPTFQEYVLIDQDAIHLLHYYKVESHQWIFMEYDDPTWSFTLQTIPFEMSLADLYEKVNFDALSSEDVTPQTDKED